MKMLRATMIGFSSAFLHQIVKRKTFEYHKATVCMAYGILCERRRRRK